MTYQMNNLTKIILFSTLLFVCFLATPVFAEFCTPLAPPTGTIETVSTELAIRDKALNAPSGTTIMISPGVYHMSNYLHITHNHITLRGTTGNREEVILDFGGMTSGHFGVLVDGNDVTLADLTIRNTTDHGVSISGADNPKLYNLHIKDSNDQLVKVNPIGDGSDNGELACSLLEYSTSAPNDYTNGISAHNAHDWTIRDNTWRRIRTNDKNVPVQTILFWSGSTNTVVERNLLIDCSRGIAFGDSSHGAGDHVGGIIRNNIIYSRLPHDTAIEMVHATGWQVAHNTVMLMNPLPGLTWGIEARYTDTVGIFYNNITNMNIWADRNGALATAASADNITNGELDWFVNPADFDFRLYAGDLPPVNQGSPANPVTTDYHGEIRDSFPDIGADEWFPQPQLKDVILILQILSGLDVSIEDIADTDGNNRLGLPEVVSLLKQMSSFPIE